MHIFFNHYWGLVVTNIQIDDCKILKFASVSMRAFGYHGVERVLDIFVYWHGYKSCARAKILTCTHTAISLTPHRFLPLYMAALSCVYIIYSLCIVCICFFFVHRTTEHYIFGCKNMYVYIYNTYRI